MHGSTLVLAAWLGLSCFGTVFAGSVTEGSSCSPSNDHIDPSSRKFTTDCDERTFCLPSSPSNSSNEGAHSTPTSSAAPSGPSGTCVKKLCRSDEFPFGYADNEPLPSLCGRGFYCPDSGRGCEPVLSVGSPCEMNRDYQCAPPRNWNTTASELNYNGSVCLQSTCMYANVTTGLPCILDRTTYSGYDDTFHPYNITVSRDNCRSVWPYLYCEPTSSLCEKMKALGASCDDDRECLSQTCSDTNICSEPPGLPVKVKPWQYALTSLSILCAVIMTCAFLALSHKRQRIERRYEVLEYYREQTSLRASIISLHTEAAQRLSREGKIHNL